jgi:rubrerythrin
MTKLTKLQEKRDVLKELWACVGCSTIMEAGKLMSGPCRPLYCPLCESSDLHPVGRETVTMPEYFGKIGTRN